MKLNGADLISRSTQNSARLLLSSSFAVTLVEYFDLKPLNWPGINGEVPAAAYEFGAGIVIAFLCISLLVHWYSDMRAYEDWFKSNTYDLGALIGGTSPKGAEPPLRAITQRLEWIESYFSDMSERSREAFERLESLEGAARDSELRKKLKEVSEEQGEIEKRLAEVKKNERHLLEILGELEGKFKRVSCVAKFVVYFWYLGLPVGGGLVAISALCFL